MIEAATRGITKDVGITMLDSTDNPVIGLTAGSITVKYRKNGAPSFSTKALLAGEWTELGDGIYLVTFTAGELDTAGNFRFLVTGGTALRHEGDLLVINDQLSLSQQIIDLKASLVNKANIRDVDVLFNQLELRVQNIELRLAQAEKQIKQLRAQLAALRGT